MPDAVAPAAPAGEGQPAPQRQGAGLLGTIVRMGMMYFLMQWMKGPQQGAQGTVKMSNPLYRKGDLLDMYVYLSEEPYLQDRSTAMLLWEQRDVGLATTEERVFETTYTPSEVSFNDN